jgi:tetratricopeptide (TPR) repeat protein
LVDRLDQPLMRWGHLFSGSMRAQIAGDTDEAEQFAGEALQLGTDNGVADATVQFGGQLIGISLQRGTLGDLAPVIEHMVADTPDLAPALLAGSLALAHVDADRIDEARPILEQFAASGFDLPLDQLWLAGMTSYAAVAIACRDPQYAAPLFDQLAPYASLLETAGGATAGAPVSYYLGGLATVLGRYEEANAYFAQAAAFNERFDAKFCAASTNLLWGNMFAERGAAGDTERARDLLTKAHEAAAANGYATVERRAAAALQHLD